MKKFSHCSPTLFLFGWPMKYFFQIEKKKLVDGWKKKVSEVTRKLKPFIFLVLKLLGATLGRLFFTFKCLNLRKIAFYSMFIKKITLFLKNHRFSHKFDWPRKSRNNCTSFSHKISFFKTKKKLYGQKRQFN